MRLLQGAVGIWAGYAAGIHENVESESQIIPVYFPAETVHLVYTFYLPRYREDSSAANFYQELQPRAPQL